jgi:hypothetical protein
MGKPAKEVRAKAGKLMIELNAIERDLFHSENWFEKELRARDDGK